MEGFNIQAKIVFLKTDCFGLPVIRVLQKRAVLNFQFADDLGLLEERMLLEESEVDCVGHRLITGIVRMEIVFRREAG